MADRTQDDRPIGELVSESLVHAQEIVRSEVRLAKVEIKAEAVSSLKAAGMLIAGGILALYALGFAIFTIVWILDSFMSTWLAGLIVTLVVGSVAAILIFIGKDRLQSLNPKPEQTIESVKEDVAWIKQQTP